MSRNPSHDPAILSDDEKATLLAVLERVNQAAPKKLRFSLEGLRKAKIIEKNAVIFKLITLSARCVKEIGEAYQTVWDRLLAEALEHQKQQSVRYKDPGSLP